MISGIYIFHICLVIALVSAILIVNEKNRRLNRKFEAFMERTERHNDKFIEDSIKLQDAMKHAINAAKSILKDRIVQACRFFIEQESINYIARENIKEMYKWFRTFANDDILINQMYSKCMELPVAKSAINIPATNVDSLEAFEELKKCQKFINTTSK